MQIQFNFKKLFVNTFFLLTFFAFQLKTNAQINGNGKAITKTFPVENLLKLEINLSADIIIDTQAKAGITITTDENVIDYINVRIRKGYLDLTQLEWIEPKGKTKVVIGAPNLESIICDAHSNVEIKNLNSGRLKLKANVGKIILEGNLEYLDLKVDLAKVNAEKLNVKTADVEIKSWGKVTTGDVETLRSDVHEDGILKVKNKSSNLSGNVEPAKSENKEARFINLKIKNNSWKRHQFYVVGPKPDGSRFSYGFPMNPGQVRDKYWTTGSKIYKVNKFGIRKLVLTIKAENEEETVDVFEKD